MRFCQIKVDMTTSQLNFQNVSLLKLNSKNLNVSLKNSNEKVSIPIRLVKKSAFVKAKVKNQQKDIRSNIYHQNKYL